MWGSYGTRKFTSRCNAASSNYSRWHAFLALAFKMYTDIYGTACVLNTVIAKLQQSQSAVCHQTWSKSCVIRNVNQLYFCFKGTACGIRLLATCSRNWGDYYRQNFRILLFATFLYWFIKQALKCSSLYTGWAKRRYTVYSILYSIDGSSQILTLVSLTFKLSYLTLW